MTDSSEPSDFADINEAVGEEWEAETTPYERVREVISHTYSQVSVDTAAEHARTSPKTARKHLETLADDGFVTTQAGDHGGTYYRRSSESLVLEQATNILERVSTDELVARISEMRDRLREFQEEYGVESPEELTVKRANQTLSEPSGGDEIDSELIRDWQTTRRNLAFANAALSIANAEKFVDGQSSSSDGSVPVQ